jgi:hypothetical protein
MFVRSTFHQQIIHIDHIRRSPDDATASFNFFFYVCSALMGFCALCILKLLRLDESSSDSTPDRKERGSGLRSGSSGKNGGKNGGMYAELGDGTNGSDGSTSRDVRTLLADAIDSSGDEDRLAVPRGSSLNDDLDVPMTSR